jgi:predicted nucleic acid-binding protein
MERVYDLFVQLCPTVFPVALADTDRGKSLLVQVPGISARDAVHAAVMLNQGINSIATFDEGFDKIPNICRVRLE